MAASQKQVDELRSLFEQKLEAGISGLPSGPHPNDLERLKDDNYVRKFINHNEGDVTAALNMLIDSLTWRRQVGANEMSESKINMDFIREGLFYPRGKDIDDCTIMIFNSKKHIKGQRDLEELKKCVVYWFERLDKVEKCDKISIFFDMADTGLSNMDMDFTKLIISLFKLYYPDFLNYIFIYEMPWVLSAAFKIIKTLLPARAVAKMKFISKSSVSEFIPLEQAQASWGGKDNYTYTFIPEPLVGNTQPSQAVSIEKKVTFSDPGSPVQDKQSLGNSASECKITLVPDDCVTFSSDGKDISGTLTLTNNHTGHISYKIKTTSPEKFRVRPSIGILAPGSSQAINLLLLEGYQNSAAGRERFLVTWVCVEKSDVPANELAEMWKDTSKLKVEQHKIRCSYPVGKTNGTLTLGKQNATSAHGDFDGDAKDIDQITSLVSALKRNQESLDKNLKTLKTIQLSNLLLTALLLCLIIYFLSSFNAASTSDHSGEFCHAP